MQFQVQCRSGQVQVYTYCPRRVGPATGKFRQRVNKLAEVSQFFQRCRGWRSSVPFSRGRRSRVSFGGPRCSGKPPSSPPRCEATETETLSDWAGVSGSGGWFDREASVVGTWSRSHAPALACLAPRRWMQATADATDTLPSIHTTRWSTYYVCPLVPCFTREMTK